MSEYFAVGFQGKIIEIATTLLNACHSHKYTPEIKIIPENTGATEFIRCPENQLVEYAEAMYKNFGCYGPYGDILSITVKKNGNGDSCPYFKVNFIAQRGFQLPKESVDLLPFVHSGDGKVYFVGITRDDDLAKGKIALMGGMVNAKGMYLETKQQAMVREAGEELKLCINPASHSEALDMYDHNVDSFAVNVSFGGPCGNLIKCPLACTLYNIGTETTGDEEEMAELDQKRVDITTGFLLLMEVGLTDPNEIKNLFKPSDDAKTVELVDLTAVKNEIDFGMSHHQKLFQRALKKIKTFTE